MSQHTHSTHITHTHPVAARMSDAEALTASEEMEVTVASAGPGAVELPEYVHPPNHEKFLERVKSHEGRLEEKHGAMQTTKKHPFSDVLTVLANDLGLGRVEELGRVEVVGGLVLHVHNKGQDDPIVTLTPRMVVQETVDGEHRLAVVSRLLFPECKQDRPHILSLGLNTATGEFDGVWLFRRVKTDLRVVGLLDGQVCMCVWMRG